MKKFIPAAIALVVAVIVGVVIGRSMDDSSDSSSSTGANGEREVMYWQAPMDPNYRRDEPGKSPMGMELVPVYAGEVDGQPGVVLIDATIINNLGVRTAKAERGPLSRRIETVGYVGYDEDTVQQVHTRVDGWIERLETKTSGDPVKKGQLLFELYSPTLVNAQEEYLTALRSNNTLLRKASKERLTALGVNASEITRLDKERSIRQRVRVTAEVDGVIAHLGVREGTYVTPSTEIMSIAELDKIWVLAEVFERQSAWVKAGQHAMVELDYVPGETWHGEVDYVYPELDPKTRTLKVRLRFDNASTMLRPNMFARVTIMGDDFGDVVHVPREALIRGGRVNRVVVALGGGRFKAQPVSIGIESGDRVAIRRGLSQGDEVVTSGQFLIDSESNIEAALSRMNSGTEVDNDLMPGMDGSQSTMPNGDDPIADEMPAMDHSQHDMPTEQEIEPEEMPGMDHSNHDEETMQ
jgi:Cu(I)/Ag(I) efflux system membrane fusion protein